MLPDFEACDRSAHLLRCTETEHRSPPNAGELATALVEETPRAGPGPPEADGGIAVYVNQPST